MAADRQIITKNKAMIQDLFEFITYLVWALLAFSVGTTYLGIKKMIDNKEQGSEIKPIILLVISISYLLAYYL